MPDRHFRPLECKPFAPGRKPELAYFGLAQPEFGLVVGDFPSFAKKPEKGVANGLLIWIIASTVT
jgi:hypothetical protein